MIAKILSIHVYKKQPFFSHLKQKQKLRKDLISLTYIGSGFAHGCKGEHGSPNNERNVHAALSAKVSIQ